MMNILDEYAVLESQIAELELKKSQLRPIILQKMIEENMEKVETPFGKFSITKLKTWQYPEEVLAIGEEFKAAKARAESTGEAEYTEKESLRFTSAKL